MSDPLKKFTCFEEEGSFISIEDNFWVKIFIQSLLFLLPPNFRGFMGLNKGFSCFVSVTPQTRGSVDYPSTRGIQVKVGLPDATLENQAESPLYEELYPNTKPA